MIKTMQFTYSTHRDLLAFLRERNYAFRSYHDYEDVPRCAILHHDINASLSCAVKLTALEAEEGVHSTWFVLLRTEFYNPFSRNGLAALQHIQSLGHEIGLHFDEASYASAPEPDEVIQNIMKECGQKSALLETEASSVSMHRPSKATLDADYQIPGIINSYGKTFFHDFKYLSDSSRHRADGVVYSILRKSSFKEELAQIKKKKVISVTLIFLGILLLVWQ